MLKLALAAAMLAAATPACAEDIPSTIIAIERAGLDLSDRGDASMFLKLSVPDVVYIDPWQEQPLVGIENLTAYYAKVFKPEAEPKFRGEMLNARVKVMGDIAVLTFNYPVTELATGKIVYRWNAVEVYNKRAGEWRIVNTHWSFTQPKLAQE